MKTNHRQLKPLARKEGLVVQELPDEILIYDLETNRAHCLNETAAFVWQRCDGRKSASEISRELSEKIKSNVDDKIVWLAVDQLSRKNLLIGSHSKLSGISRREMVRVLGLSAAIAIPVVASIVAPQPAEAATCLPNGTGCESSTQCCSSLCSGGVCTGGA